MDPVKEIRGSQWKKGIARVVVEMTRNDVGYHIGEETPDGLVVSIETTNGQAAKLTDTAPATPKVVSKPVVVAAVKPDEKPAASASTDALADTPKLAPKPVVVAAAKPAEKPAPAASPAPITKRNRRGYRSAAGHARSGRVGTRAPDGGSGRPQPWPRRPLRPRRLRRVTS